MTPPSTWSAVLVTVGATLLLGGYGGLVREVIDADGSNAAIIIVFAAAAISSIVGFAFSGLCGPMLALLDLDPVQMVQLMAVSSIALQGGGPGPFAGISTCGRSFPSPSAGSAPCRSVCGCC